MAEDKIYCVYKASKEELIKDYAKQGSFSANSFTKVSAIIDSSKAK